MATPEGKIKKIIKNFLTTLGPDLYYEMPVPTGYGKSGLDFVGCYFGAYFQIEAKAPGERPTVRQEFVLGRVARAGGAGFHIDGEQGLETFKAWCQKIKSASLRS